MKQESKLAVHQFQQNNRIASSGMFQYIIEKNKNTNEIYKFIIDNEIIETSNSIELLVMIIDSKLKFDGDFSDLYEKASMQLNAMSRVRK